MESGTFLLWCACALGVGAVAVLRYAWALPRRVAAANAAGWLLVVASVVCGALYAGAWGISVAALVTTAAACMALAVAGATSPRGRAAPVKERSGTGAQARQGRAIGRRVTTFLLVMPGAFLAALALGLAMRGLGTMLGWGEADAIVAALFTVPLAWAVLAVVLLMQAQRRGQAFTLLGCALASVPFMLTGFGS